MRPFLVAIAGGSGSGKTWLAEQLVRAFEKKAARICLDDFYLDRSHLTPAQRERVNFDHPRAVDWAALEKVLDELSRGKPAQVPQYDFGTHSRLSRRLTVRPRPIVIVEGLWVLRRPSLRRRCHYAIFLRCLSEVRLERRLLRDVESRGRTRISVSAQFRAHVEPMHCRYVEPQARHADLVLDADCPPEKVEAIARHIAELAGVRR